MKIELSVESCADIPAGQMRAMNIHCVPMPYIINGSPVLKIFDDIEEYYDFYELLDKGETPTSAQINRAEYEEYFNSLVQNTEGDILHFALSSGLSGSCETARVVAEEINKTLEGRKVVIFDSLGATQVIAVIVEKAVEKRAAGATLDEIVKICEEARDRTQAWITVDDLKHLRRGGRVSGPAAMIGNLLDIKPIIIFNPTGHLIVAAKVRGQNKAFAHISAMFGTLGKDVGKLIIVHTGRASRAAAESLGQRIKEDHGAEYEIRNVGPVIGLHLGPNAIAALYVGEKRVDA
ncbi:MAG: DegV family protein [Firmicutes bacterium]|nr:DegV family protein [Bacillota bacterium]